MSSWAKSHGHVHKTVRNQRGGVIECKDLERRWRIEWGDSQRLYIEGTELRMREELGVSPDFQLLLLSRTLATKLETDVFDRFTEAMQTQIDHTLPEEMRWLAMFPRVSLGDNKPLKARYVLQSPNAEAAQAWVAGEMSEALIRAAQGFLFADPSFVLMVLRGKLYLRMQAPKVDDVLLDGADALFRLAAARARTAEAMTGNPSSVPSSLPGIGAGVAVGAAPSEWGSGFSASNLITQAPSELPSVIELDADPSADPPGQALAHH